MSDPRYHNGQRWVGGTAAWLHTISKDGGWGPHHEKFALEVLQKTWPELQTLRAPEQRYGKHLKRIK